MHAAHAAKAHHGARRAPCWPGSAAGAWVHGYEWRLNNASRGKNGTACTPLHRFVHVEPTRCGRKQASCVPNAPPSSLRSCSVRDEPLIAAELGNASVLMLGDSTSAQVLWHACEAFDSRPASFISVNARDFNVSLRKYSHRLRSLDNHACRLPGGVAFGSFSHYGATGPPYWAFAYPLAPWLANTTAGMMRRDAPKFRELTTPRGADPTLVVASSGFWDIAAWWAHEGNFSRHWSCNANHTIRYVAGVRMMVREVRRAFPRSAVVWRLMHPGQKHSISPRIVEEFNAGVRAAAPGWRLPLIDVEAMVGSLSRAGTPNLGRGAPYGTSDGRHLHPWVNMALLNVLLNVARRARDGELPYGAAWRGNSTQLNSTHTV